MEDIVGCCHDDATSLEVHILGRILVTPGFCKEMRLEAAKRKLVRKLASIAADVAGSTEKVSINVDVGKEMVFLGIHTIFLSGVLRIEFAEEVEHCPFHLEMDKEP